MKTKISCGINIQPSFTWTPGGCPFAEGLISVRKSGLSLDSISEMSRTVQPSLCAQSAKHHCWTQTALGQSSEKKIKTGVKTTKRSLSLEWREHKLHRVTQTREIWTVFPSQPSSPNIKINLLSDWGKEKIPILLNRAETGEVYWGHTNNSYLPWKESKREMSCAELYVKGGKFQS